MLKIRKDGDEKIVTSGAFKNLYESMGYEIIEDKGSVEKVATPIKEVAPKTEEKVENTTVENIEKPKIVIKKTK